MPRLCRMAFGIGHSSQIVTERIADVCPPAVLPSHLCPPLPALCRFFISSPLSCCPQTSQVKGRSYGMKLTYRTLRFPPFPPTCLSDRGTWGAPSDSCSIHQSCSSCATSLRGRNSEGSFADDMRSAIRASSIAEDWMSVLAQSLV